MPGQIPSLLQQGWVVSWLGEVLGSQAWFSWCHLCPPPGMSPRSPLGAFGSSAAPGRAPSDLRWGLDERVEHSQGWELLPWGSPGSLRLQLLGDFGAEEFAGSSALPCPELELNAPNKRPCGCGSGAVSRIRREGSGWSISSYPALGMASPLLPSI